MRDLEKEFKELFKPPTKIVNTHPGGQCEVCGKNLGAQIWREGENTACSKAHCEELQRLEFQDLIQDEEDWEHA